MRNIDSQSRPRTQFRFKYLAIRIRLLRLGGSLTTFSTVSAQSGHSLVHCTCPLLGVKRTCRLPCEMSPIDPKRTLLGLTPYPPSMLVLADRMPCPEPRGRQ